MNRRDQSPEPGSHYYSRDIAAFRRTQCHPASPELFEQVLDRLYHRPTLWEQRIEATRIAIRETFRTGTPHTASDFLELVVEGPLTEAEAAELEAFHRREEEMTLKSHFLGSTIAEQTLEDSPQLW